EGQLFTAAQQGYTAEVEALLQMPMNPDVVPSIDGDSPSAGEERAMRRYVRTMCASLDYTLFEPEWGESTALNRAARRNHPEVVELLLEAEANVNFV
ncbi:mask, partial [Symbiodinium sp. CCMP2456]